MRWLPGRSLHLNTFIHLISDASGVSPSSSRLDWPRSDFCRSRALACFVRSLKIWRITVATQERTGRFLGTSADGLGPRQSRTQVGKWMRRGRQTPQVAIDNVRSVIGSRPSGFGAWTTAGLAYSIVVYPALDRVSRLNRIVSRVNRHRWSRRIAKWCLSDVAGHRGVIHWALRLAAPAGAAGVPDRVSTTDRSCKDLCLGLHAESSDVCALQ